MDGKLHTGSKSESAGRCWGPSRRRIASQGSRMELVERRQFLAAHVSGSSAVYATIQAAMDAAGAGAIVSVDPGTYQELVFINKPLTIKGARAGVDARTNSRGAESIVRGVDAGGGVRTSSFVITADNVTLDGFTVQDNASNGQFGAGIVIAPAISGTHIVNNIVQNNLAGLFLSNNSATNPAVIQHNLFRDNNRPGNNTGRGIYTDGGVTGGTLTNVIIDSNAFIRNFGGLPEASREAAIDFHAGPASSQTNIQITNNVFDDNGKALLALNASNIALRGNLVVATRDTRSAAVRFEGGVHDVTIKNNTIYNNIARAIRIDKNASSGDNFNFLITGNNIYGNAFQTGVGVNRDGLFVNEDQFDGSIDARNNWWGSSSGPSGDGPGAGDAVFANGNDVAFIPWATAPVGNLQVPFFGLPANAESRIDLANFDRGGEGVAYHDFDKANRGTKLHPTEGVDIQSTADSGSGFDVGFTVAGEWIEYTIDVTSPGKYSADFRVASAQATGGKFHLEVDGVNVTSALAAPNTGGWQAWQTISKAGVNLTAGRHVLRLAMDTNGSGGAIANFNWLKLTRAGDSSPTTPPDIPTGELPAPWNHQDIGPTTIAGGAAQSNGAYAVAGSGTDVWGNSDGFQFAYQKLDGDGEIVARVAGMENGNPLAKSGIMLRDTLAASSRQASLFVTPGAGVRFIRRHATGGASTSATDTNNAGVTAPQWLKLVRAGNVITAYRSADGVNWLLVGSDQIAMAQSIYVGLAVTSHQASATITATFDNVSVP